MNKLKFVIEMIGDMSIFCFGEKHGDNPSIVYNYNGNQYLETNWDEDTDGDYHCYVREKIILDRINKI